MVDTLRELGKVSLVQLQPSGLIIETPTGSYYDVSRRLEVDQLQITSLGIEAFTPDGQHVLDIHHISHPDKAYGNNDLVCIGFTSHYEAMRARFGEHIVDGAAGENIIIDCAEEIWPADLGKGIAIEDQETGHLAILDLVSFTAPCDEFSHFVSGSQEERLPADVLKDTLQFLGNGRRGYLLLLRDGQETAIVRRGDKVFVLS